MNYEEVKEKNFLKMTQTPVKKLVCILAVPTIISMMITSIYNMADTYFVSQIGTSASGAVGISFSLMAIIQAIGFTLGTGSGTFISRLLGQKDMENASKVAATGFVTAFGLGILLAVLGFLLIDPLIKFLGATETIAPYAKDYIRYILIGMPYMTSAFVLNVILRLQGSAFYAMMGIGTGGILNIILDPIFIYKFNMGTSGAALATIISQFISFCILWHNSGMGGTIKINIRKFTPKWWVYREILRGGLPSFYRQSLGSLAIICLNFNAAPYGDAAIAAMSIVTRVFQFTVSALFGFGQGFQPVCGFNYGAKLYDRVIEAFWFCVKLATIVLISIGIITFFVAPQVMAFFRRDDIEVISIGTVALRFQCVTFPLSAWVVICNMLLQTIGKGAKASLLAVSRQGLFFFPTIFILTGVFGLFGIQISQPVADIVTFLLAIPLGLSVLKEMNELQKRKQKEII